MMTTNQQARAKAARRNKRWPRDKRKEKEWKQKYRQHLIYLGLTPEEAMGMDPEVDLAYDPEDAASDEIYYMAQDSYGN